MILNFRRVVNREDRLHLDLAPVHMMMYLPKALNPFARLGQSSVEGYVK